MSPSAHTFRTPRLPRRFSAATAFASVLLAAGLVHAAPDVTTRPAIAAAAGPAGPAASSPRKHAPPVRVKLVDINSASRTELKTLPGIGDAQADKIIANRPYLTKAELVTKQVLVTGPYLSLKDRVVAMQKTRPKAPAKP